MPSEAQRIKIHRGDPRGEVASQLIHELTADIAQRYSDHGDDGTGFFKVDDVTVPRSVFLIAELDGRPVGCGALRPIDAEVAEVKRMYVVPASRRMGVGRRLLTELERVAAEFGYHTLRLE